MGVEGMTRPMAEAMAIDMTKNTANQTTTGAVPVPVPAAAAATPSSSMDSALSMEELCRRRTSIPSSFTYGGGEILDDDEPATPSSSVAGTTERRWRSFDCNGSSAASSVDELLCSRIQREQQRVDRQSARLRPRKRSAQLLRSFFTSARRQEQIALRHMELVAQVATGSRSLVVLQNMRALVFTMDQDEDGLTSDASALDTPRSVGSVSGGSDTTLQRMLDGLADADQVLAEDSLHHILELQAQFFARAVELHADKKVLPVTSGVTASLALQQFLSEFTQRVPCVLDTPTVALIRFEKLLTRFKLLKPAVKKSLDQLCRDTMSSFTTNSNNNSNNVACIWDAREPRDVMQSLVRELEDAVVETAFVAASHRATLKTFLEQMVFSRLAAACYRSKADELDEMNAKWREQTVRARALQLDEVGLPVDVPLEETTHVLAASIAAFNKLPHLVPSSVLASFLSAVRVLYCEATSLLGISCGCISADVLLPLLVFVLSRTDLPHLHSQVFVMEHFAIDASQEGSEAAYYVACLQAAMGYIMTEVGKPCEPQQQQQQQ